MNRALTVISLTLRQAVRRRFLWAAGLVCVLIAAASHVLGGLSLDEAQRTAVNFSLSGAQIALSLITLLFAAVFISRDLEKKTLLPVLTRPVPPWLFFFSRIAGLALLIFGAVFAVGLVLAGFFLLKGISLSANFPQIFFGFYLECLLLLAASLFFSSVSGPFWTLAGGVTVFFAGRSADSLNYLFGGSAGAPFLPFLIPDLNRVNWKAAAVYGDIIPFQEFAFSSLYIIGWTGFIGSLGLLILQKKQYG